MAEPEHEHYWRRATIRDGRDQPVPGRRCDCGMETIGALNADVVRAAQRATDGMSAAVVRLAQELKPVNDAIRADLARLNDRIMAERRRRFEP